MKSTVRKCTHLYTIVRFLIINFMKYHSFWKYVLPKLTYSIKYLARKTDKFGNLNKSYPAKPTFQVFKDTLSFDHSLHTVYVVHVIIPSHMLSPSVLQENLNNHHTCIVTSHNPWSWNTQGSTQTSCDYLFYISITYAWFWLFVSCVFSAWNTQRKC